MDVAYEKRCRNVLKELEERRWGQALGIEEIYRRHVDYGQRRVMQEEITGPGWEPFCNGERWGGRDIHDCFQVLVTVSEQVEGQELWFACETGALDIWNTDNPQFLVYLGGEIVCGMDMNHHEVCVCESARAGEQLRIGLYAYSNSTAETDYLRLSVKVKYPEVEQLYYDYKVLLEGAELLREEDVERAGIFRLLNQAANQLELRRGKETEFLSSVQKVRLWLEDNYFRAARAVEPVTVHSIGHTHIDVAWKWPLRQTKEKAVRSFATVLQLMERYPEYRFMSSQPQLYQFVKEEEPALYERIKERIAQGRWEPEGSMWLEPDCNLISGESMVRQILYGKAFFRQEFGKGDNVVLWLPDVFGYSAAMPQIMQKSGIRYFMTTKINWNEYNKFPNDVMYWRGIDGSEVLTYFISTTNYEPYPELQRKRGHSTTYNGRQNISQVMGTWQRFSNKELTRDVLTCFGHGDGGGGPTMEMLEESRRLERGVADCPVVRQTFSREFFELLEENLSGRKVPRWDGELYLEFHRGTYTSMARNKKYNRQCELLHMDVELLATLAMLTEEGYSYPAKRLEAVWKMTLLNQFHDILPGSSIKEVYEDSREQYEWILEEDEKLLEEAAAQLCGEEGEPRLVFFNTLGFKRNALVRLSREQYALTGEPCGGNPKKEGTPPGSGENVQWCKDGSCLIALQDIPAKGYITAGAAYPATDKNREASREQANAAADFRKLSCGWQLETPHYRICFSPEGEISSLYDRDYAREVCMEGRKLNELLAFEDKPCEYDAWNIDAFYEEKCWKADGLEAFVLEENGPLAATVYLRRPFLQSCVEQWITVYRDSRRVDFRTRIDWKEEQILLKAAFPIDVLAGKAVFDIQFGNVERPTHRNTSWDQARFEVCSHKWIDMAENGYGVALLNDCKYGADVLESTVRLTLLKSGIFPNPDADKEVHEFTYSLLPHEGDFRQGGVVQEAYALNVPVRTLVMKGMPKPGAHFSLLAVDCDNVQIETVKAAEDGGGIIVRMYEAYGRRSRVTCTCHSLMGERVTECDLLERPLEEAQEAILPVHTQDGYRFTFTIKPYEIKTFRMTDGSK